MAKSSSDYLRNAHGESTVVHFSSRAARSSDVDAYCRGWIEDVAGGDRWSMSSAFARKRSLSNDP
ncbi:hypothetical protein PAMC26577_02150 [Caballeronia sordidicola]|uniref:Uncharacterized protein n=1 Tax=Caballeronia sordidicola TaxID=196367 RepID=A0A242N784_CABSO|nr:hypothetical protein PAMC26577_02150 [Caballeronia sordidicola]